MCEHMHARFDADQRITVCRLSALQLHHAGYVLAAQHSLMIAVCAAPDIMPTPPAGVLQHVHAQPAA
jgi:hypothetical protein